MSDRGGDVPVLLMFSSIAVALQESRVGFNVLSAIG
jgi:hypothetical protein